MQAVATDYSSTDIISHNDRSIVVDEVNIVFNVIATIKFNESLHEAVNINMLNTQKIVKLACEMRELKSFIHISTLFSNCDRREDLVEEKIYDHPFNYHQLIALADITKSMESHDSVKLTFEHKFPNSYTLTKHFAEKLVCDQADQLPIGIFRPPIVGSAYKNVPGWTDNLNGITASGVIFSSGVGHCLLAGKHNPTNMVPVDYCISAIISAAWDVNKKFESAKSTSSRFSIPIYNYIFKENNLTFNDMLPMFSLGFHAPLEQSVYYFAVIMTTSLAFFKFWHTIFTTFPAYLMDAFALLRGHKAKNKRIARKIDEFFGVINFFTLTKFKFENKNVLQLVDKAKRTENFREELEFDMRTVDWREYFSNWLPGIKQYFFKEDMSKVPILAKRYAR